jgi:hypothetical protein
MINLAKRLTQILARQDDRQSTVTDDNFTQFCYDCIKILDPVVSKVEGKLPLARRIGKLPSQLKQCVGSKGEISRELALETSNGVLATIATFFKKDDDFEERYSFPELTESSTSLLEEVVMHTYRVELA